MILYRFEDSMGYGPACAGVVRDEKGIEIEEHYKREWKQVRVVPPLSQLIEVMVYCRYSPFEDPQLCGIRKGELSAVTEEQFIRAAREIDGEEFVWPEQLKRIEVPDEQVRVGYCQVLFRREMGTGEMFASERPMYEDSEESEP